MNKRIKELHTRATEWALDNYPPPVNTFMWEDARSKKFAELIVRECIAQCEQVATDADAVSKSTFVTDAGRMLHEGAWGGAKNCGVQIREHFGVKE